MQTRLSIVCTPLNIDHIPLLAVAGRPPSAVPLPQAGSGPYASRRGLLTQNQRLLLWTLLLSFCIKASAATGHLWRPEAFEEERGHAPGSPQGVSSSVTLFTAIGLYYTALHQKTCVVRIVCCITFRKKGTRSFLLHSPCDLSAHLEISSGEKESSKVLTRSIMGRQPIRSYVAEVLR